MITFDEFLEKQLQNEEFKKEWDDLEPERQIIKAMLDARNEQNLTQKELANKTGINQADISRIESGDANPTLATLKKIANGLNMKLKIEFIQK